MTKTARGDQRVHVACNNTKPVINEYEIVTLSTIKQNNVKPACASVRAFVGSGVVDRDVNPLPWAFEFPYE